MEHDLFGKPASTFPDHALSTFAGRCRMDRERVNTAGKLARERGVDHAMTLQPALPAKSFRHDIEAEVRFAARPVSCVALVPVRLVFHAKTLRCESLVQLFCDEIERRHDFVSTGMFRKVENWCFKMIMLPLKIHRQAWQTRAFAFCQVLKLPSTHTHT